MGEFIVDYQLSEFFCNPRYLGFRRDCYPEASFLRLLSTRCHDLGRLNRIETFSYRRQIAKTNERAFGKEETIKDESDADSRPSSR